jgi:diguanylate cyclase (GGDEF)-like protein
MLDTGIPAAVVLVALAALASRVRLVVAPRASVSVGGPFVVAASLVGGPLVGVVAGASTGSAAGALQGVAVGLAAQQLPQRGVSGAVALATVGLLIGSVSSGRSNRRRGFLVWVLAGPLLATFLYVFGTSPGLALAFAAGSLLVLVAGGRSVRRLERVLAAERSRSRADALTSAPNRYALAEALTAEQARIRRGGRTAALCFLDLDRFKTVNDTYGYAAGDALLVDVYERLRGELRASDRVFRWGGEEFVVLAPHVESTELADFAERLRLLVATRPFAIDGRPRTITSSVGAVLLDDDRAADAALDAAGRLVRKAKLTRNAAVVESAGPRPSSPARRPRADDRRIERYLAAR